MTSSITTDNVYSIFSKCMTLSAQCMTLSAQWFGRWNATMQIIWFSCCYQISAVFRMAISPPLHRVYLDHQPQDDRSLTRNAGCQLQSALLLRGELK